MKPADTYAALRAIQYGIGAAVDRAAEIVEQVRENTGAKSFETPYGPVTFTKRAPAISINPARVLRDESKCATPSPTGSPSCTPSTTPSPSEEGTGP